ncbi:TIGR02117 family protein [Sphingomonas glaciei]|uniref:TIGR02117 family protein n=1 Tax=Sphingomonas glaciei TaxID=2938948 RepID=A0ABY5MR88_9SPHN|nr:TIGR02117 family protein [Sphingomonas glaciei]UUR06912.1 TIGR02117 family protein [Sphingomonas glaciei]
MTRGAKRRGRKRGLGRRLWLALAALPLAYLLAAVAGSLLPVNRGWQEPAEGTTIYLRSNGIHVDIVMPARAQGLDWSTVLPPSDVADPPLPVRWYGFGAGERRVYLETPTWGDLTPRTVWAALSSGERVLHVDQTAKPGFELRAIRLRPEEYRRLWSAIRAEFDGQPRRIDHPGYGPDDAFYEARGRASAVQTCNQWVADRLRLAGVKTSAWTPFATGLMWRYRRVELEDVAR